MYVTIREYDGVEFPEEAAAKVRNEFLPIVSKIPGFHYALKTGEMTVASISIFKDKPGADESVRAARDWVSKNLSKYLPNPPKVITGEPIAHAAAKARQSAASPETPIEFIDQALRRAGPFCLLWGQIRLVALGGVPACRG